MLFLARNSRIPKALWAGALSWWSSHDLVSHSSLLFSLTERIRRRKMFLWTCWLIIWPCGKNSAWTIPWTSRKAISITLVLDMDTLAFLGLDDNALFYSRLCRLVSGSYSKIHDSSPVTTLFSKLGSVSSCFKMSWHICTRRSFRPSFSNLGTTFAQIFLIPRSSIMILHTFSLFIPSSSATILTVRRRSLRTFCLTRSTFSSVLLVDDLPLLWSSSTSSLPSLNLLCHSKRRVLCIVPSPWTFWGNFSVLVGVFPRRTRNFRLIRCSTLILCTKQEKKAKNS